MSVHTYEYTAVTAPQTIRLMRIHPGSGNNPVQISLETIALDVAPDFEAISYCWGNPDNRRQVICNEKVLSITSSLFTGLAHLRHVKQPRLLWADAVCINQADPVEKSSQVLLMPLIYSRAVRVLVWLGSTSDPVYGRVPSHVNDTIQQALQMLPEFDMENTVEMAAKTRALYEESLRQRAEGKPNLLDHDWVPLVRLLRRPWFRRKWVVQEVSLAREALLCIGGEIEIRWLDFARLSFALEAFAIYKRWKVNPEGCNEARQTQVELNDFETEFRPTVLSLHLVSAMYMVQLYRHGATLVDGILTTKFFYCTDPRDHVFSLLSLGGIGPSVAPDYEASVSTVFQRFSIAMLLEGQSLKLLSLAPDRSIYYTPDVQRLKELPTWVPDLRLMRSDALPCYSTRPQAFFAGGHGKPKLSVSDNERTLHCQGQLVDAPAIFSTSLIEMILADIPELQLLWENINDPIQERREKRFIRWLEGCYDIAFAQGRSHGPKPVQAADLTAAFSRTMLCGMDFMRNRLSPQLIPTISRYIEWVLGRAADDGTKQDPIATPELLTTARETMLALTIDLKFCVTESGRFGQVPTASQPGDRICVFVGGEVPFVVRPTGHGTYTLIGECYVDGIMDGEALETAASSGTPLEIISLE